MKRLLTLLLVLPFLTFAQEPPAMVEFFEVTVKHGNQKQFYEGMKKYKKCHEDNSTDAVWDAWWRMQGEGTKVVFVRNIQNYAEFDEMNEDDNKCQSIVDSDLVPNSSSIKRNFMSPIADWSVAKEPGGKVANVTFFEIDNGRLFREAVSEVVNTIKGHEKFNSHWMSAVGGDDYDYAIVNFYDKFADMDDRDFNVWKIFEEKHGAEKLKKVREKLDKAISNVDQFMYSYDESISYNGSANSGE